MKNFGELIVKCSVGGGSQAQQCIGYKSEENYMDCAFYSRLYKTCRNPKIKELIEEELREEGKRNIKCI